MASVLQAAPVGAGVGAGVGARLPGRRVDASVIPGGPAVMNTRFSVPEIRVGPQDGGACNCPRAGKRA